MSGIIENNKVVISQLTNLIQQFSDDDYSTKLEVFNGASIGMHIRHILEFYTCFLEQTDNTQVCYDSRKRQLIYEINTAASIEKLYNIQSGIELLDINNSIEVKTNSGIEEDNNDFVKSSVGRELLYTLDHAIHHMALIKIGVQLNFDHINFPEGFGIAPSTIRHNNKSCAQ
jgi:uncharacterized damage-inducible protein DinB